MYGELIRTIREPLVAASGLDALRTLGSLLEAAVAASRASDDEEDVEDYSFVWRPEIEGAGNSNDDVRNSLVGTVRDSALDLSAAGDEAVEQVVDVLKRHRFTVFGRIALFVLRERAVLRLVRHGLVRALTQHTAPLLRAMLRLTIHAEFWLPFADFSRYTRSSMRLSSVVGTKLLPCKDCQLSISKTCPGRERTMSLKGNSLPIASISSVAFLAEAFWCG